MAIHNTMHQLSDQRIKEVINSLQKVPTHGNFLLETYADGMAYNANETGWLVDNGFAIRPLVKADTIMYIRLTDRGIWLRRLKSLKILRVKEGVDELVKYLPIIISIAALVVSIIALNKRK